MKLIPHRFGGFVVAHHRIDIDNESSIIVKQLVERSEQVRSLWSAQYGEVTVDHRDEIELLIGREVKIILKDVVDCQPLLFRDASSIANGSFREVNAADCGPPLSEVGCV